MLQRGYFAAMSALMRSSLLTLLLSLTYLDKHFYLLFKRCYTDAPEKRLETGVKRKGIIVLHDYVCVCVCGARFTMLYLYPVMCLFRQYESINYRDLHIM